MCDILFQVGGPSLLNFFVYIFFPIFVDTYNDRHMSMFTIVVRKCNMCTTLLTNNGFHLSYCHGILMTLQIDGLFDHYDIFSAALGCISQKQCVYAMYQVLSGLLKFFKGQLYVSRLLRTSSILIGDQGRICLQFYAIVIFRIFGT